MSKVQMVCPNCGSDDIARDAAARWDCESQEWELTALYGAGCDSCGVEFDEPEEKPLKGGGNMTREDAKKYVSYCLEIDDPLCFREVEDVPENARIVGWQCGFEPMCVAVWSGTGEQVTEADAEEIALEFLRDIHWFVDGPRDADFVL